MHHCNLGTLVVSRLVGPDSRPGRRGNRADEELHRGERLKSIVHLGSHPTAGLPLGDSGGLPEGMHGAMDHDGRLPGRGDLEGVVEDVVRGLIEAPVVHHDIEAVGEPWMKQPLLPINVFIGLSF